jgi:hypothetical protein
MAGDRGRRAAGRDPAVAQLGKLGPLGHLRNWGNWDHWGTWAVDELTAALLLAAALLALRGNPRYLAPAWAFSTALYLSSLVTRLYSLPLLPDTIYASELRLTQLVGGLLAVSLAGLALGLRERPSA